MTAGSACAAIAHVKGASIWQVDEQPSLFLVLPSSHASPGKTMPSPHDPAHTPPLFGQTGSFTHVGEQPSYGTRLLSSHCRLGPPA